MFTSYLICLQILPYLLTLPERLAEVLGGAGPSAADQWTAPGEDQRAAEAVGAASHPAEVARTAGRLLGEGVAVTREGLASRSVKA